MGASGVSRSRGVTLVELLAVVALVAIVQALAVPAMTRFTGSICLGTTSRLLHSSLIFARSEAIKRNSRVVVCRSATGTACSTSGGWQDGWIVFHDINNNARLDPGEMVLIREAPSASALRLSGNTPVSNYVSYTGLGVARMTSDAFQAGTFTACIASSGRTESSQLVLSNTGRVRTTKAVVDNCI
jgi:type IV fimbrial biogenesis protein FimT